MNAHLANQSECADEIDCLAAADAALDGFGWELPRGSCRASVVTEASVGEQQGGGPMREGVPEAAGGVAAQM